LAAKVAPYAGNLTRWFVSEIGSFGLVFVQFLLTVALSAVLYASGEKAASRRAAFRLSSERRTRRERRRAGRPGGACGGAGRRRDRDRPVASRRHRPGHRRRAVRPGPDRGDVHVLHRPARTGLVLAPAVVWLYWGDNTGWGTFLLVWTVVVGTMDNFLRPLLIKQGADLPLLLILAGVIGGMLAFGLVGLFVGPVILAVGYTLLDAWINEVPRESAGCPSTVSDVPAADRQKPA
jgi:predicted PurR-regulated permease PerM